ncbi:MAG: shikimate kinase [Niabella sp.]
MRIYLIGFMGAGKTHWGKKLAHALELPFFDLDELIVSMEEKTVTEIFDEHGEEYFRTKEKEVLEWVTQTHPEMVLSCGGGTPCFFNNIAYMNTHGTTVWLNTPTEILLGRLRQQKANRPLLKNLDDEQLRTYIVKKTADRRIFYEQSQLRVGEQELTIEDFIKKIRHA